MSDIIIRGLNKRIHQRLQKLAKSRSASMNQTLLEIIQGEIERIEGRVNEEKRRKEAFARTEQIRAELHKKYGKFDDSTKLIREDRDSR